jgi:hypothetical protein
MKDGRVTVERPPGSPPLTDELLKKFEEEEYEAEYQRAMFPQR